MQSGSCFYVQFYLTVKPGLHIIITIPQRACDRLCSIKEGLKAVNKSTGNISCEI